jgi:hypothetical protein
MQPKLTGIAGTMAFACLCLPPAAVASQPTFAFTDMQFLATWNKQNGGGQGMPITRLAPGKGNVEKIVFETTQFYSARKKMSALNLVPADTPMTLGGSLFIDLATRKVTRIELTGDRGDFLNLSNADGNIVSLIHFFNTGLTAERASKIANETLGGMRGDDDPRCGENLFTTIGKARISHLVRPSSQSHSVITQAVPVAGR